MPLESWGAQPGPGAFSSYCALGQLHLGLNPHNPIPLSSCRVPATWAPSGCGSDPVTHVPPPPSAEPPCWDSQLTSEDTPPQLLPLPSLQRHGLLCRWARVGVKVGILQVK
uniref:Uncharacterized protein n=1 Tax=Nomascus leucogenys TaxID=61853 RepID=A0A2I3GMB7_NOMLE